LKQRKKIEAKTMRLRRKIYQDLMLLNLKGAIINIKMILQNPGMIITIQERYNNG